MKKEKIIRSSMLIVLLSMLALPTFSQIKIGVKADVGLNNPKFNNETLKVENMTAYSVGPTLEMMFPFAVLDFGLETSLLYNDNRMTISRLTGDEPKSSDVSNRYLTLPLNAKVKLGLGGLPIKLFGTAGPYAGYLISSDKVDFGEIRDDVKAKEFQAGANVGFGLELFKMLQVGVNYKVQLTDNYSVNEPNWRDPLNGKTETWSITGAIYF
ncbi:porin family protein [Proteiniphilum sp.]|uniref:porin family protein n=1 Tax=Proteiniphilum sp. TaxID=1926877 RepID=UPI002B1FBF38|nr:porin family protein [Proteiniphilum sp.]MEA4916663.1 porin family protein [Proteiniphilum sp.]